MALTSRIRRGIRNPKLFFREANRKYYTLFGEGEFNTEGTDILSEDWDNLLILDACRYDMFESKSNLPGDLSHRLSRGSNTTEFLKANLNGNDLSDTVYVTANPQLHRNSDKINASFHHVVPVWQQEGWDAELGTVLPETMNKYAKQASVEYPNKRLVVHYIQPHYPFLSETTEADKGHINDPQNKLNVWNLLMNGSLKQEQQVIKAYHENLDEVLPAVEALLTELQGKSVVTSDHGNMLGERAFPFPIREWGHPRGLYMEELIKVPWHTYQNGTRKDIKAGPQTNWKDDPNETVEERLEQLGYT